MQSHLADIDELVLRCRDDEARQYIAEAVASYKMGAFRACIVMTWIAVLYDFLYKLRELELAGDRQAKAKLEEFETASRDKDHNKSLEFERSVLKCAHEDFEFINNIEFQELQRLQDDRNRCAHPSMISTDEIYSPSSELARYHLRNAVNYMLQYPPTQGKTFVDSLLKDTESAFFPTDVDEAVRYLEAKQINRAKASVVRNLTLSMMKGIIKEEFDDVQVKRTATALQALRRIRRDVTENVLEQNLSKTIITVQDTALKRVCRYLRNVPDCHEFLSEDVLIRLRNYILNAETMGEIAEAIDVGIRIPNLRDEALQRLGSMDDDVSAVLLVLLVEKEARIEYVEKAISAYQVVDSFDRANFMAMQVLIPLISAKLISPDDVCLCQPNLSPLTHEKWTHYGRL